jgi:hypothetical protein
MRKVCKPKPTTDFQNMLEGSQCLDIGTTRIHTFSQ